MYFTPLCQFRLKNKYVILLFGNILDSTKEKDVIIKYNHRMSSAWLYDDRMYLGGIFSLDCMPFGSDYIETPKIVKSFDTICPTKE